MKVYADKNENYHMNNKIWCAGSQTYVPKIKSVVFKALMAAMEEYLGVSLWTLGHVNHKSMAVETEPSDTTPDSDEKESALILIEYDDEQMYCMA